MNEQKKKSLVEEYDGLVGGRSSFLTRGEEYSKMSLPYILPRTKTDSAQNKHGYQGIGAEAVNHLANKIISTLFPVSEPFYMLKFDDEAEAEIKDKELNRSELDAGLNKVVDLSLIEMKKMKLRPRLVSLAKHLIIGGNSLLVFTAKGTKLLGLDKFVVKRDPQGNPLKIISKEQVSILSLPQEIKLALMSKQVAGTSRDEDELLTLLTGYFLQPDGTWTITQTVDDIPAIPPITGVEEDLLPCVANTWNLTSGEDYGRGLMEDHSGDFHVLEFLSEARARGAATMMDVKYLVRAGAITDIETLNKAPTGEFVIGNEDDITVLQLDKFADGRLIQDVMNEYQERISRAFLMLQNSIRDSERTTAYEIQKVANELDGSLGGLYSSLSVDLQPKVAFQLLDAVDSDLINGDFKPVVTSGIDALGRNRELEKIAQYSEMMALPASWAEPLQQAIDWRQYSNLVSSQISLDTSFLKSEEQMQEEQEGQADQQTDSVMADSLASSAGAALGKQMIEDN